MMHREFLAASDSAAVRHTAAAIFRAVRRKDFLIDSALGNPNSIIRMIYRKKITNNDQIFLFLVKTLKSNHTLGIIIIADP